MDNETILAEVKLFVDKLNTDFVSNYGVFDFTVGPKFAKIIEVENNKNNKRVWGFIAISEFNFKGEDLRLGDLMKAATYNAPAKGSRGNILRGTAQYNKFGPSYKWRITENLTDLELKLKFNLV